MAIYLSRDLGSGKRADPTTEPLERRGVQSVEFGQRPLLASRVLAVKPISEPPVAALQYSLAIDSPVPVPFDSRHLDYPQFLTVELAKTFDSLYDRRGSRRKAERIGQCGYKTWRHGIEVQQAGWLGRGMQMGDPTAFQPGRQSDVEIQTEWFGYLFSEELPE